jgi:hypothetical protein
MDFFDRFIEFKGEEDQVHSLEIAVLLQENGPCGIGDQIYLVPLIVAVTEATHTTQKVAQVHQGYQRLRFLAVLDGMMMCDHLDDIVGQRLFFGQRLPGFAMGESHSGPFRLVQRNSLLAGTLHRQSKVLGKCQAIDHEP